MKLVYVANSIVPSRTANSIHVMKMCAAFARVGHEVTLLVPRRPERAEDVANAYDYYGVAPEFRIHSLPWIRARGRGYVYAWLAAQYSRRVGAEIVYGRVVHACYLATLRGVPAMFESHAPVTDFDSVGVWMFRRLIRQRHFRGMVVISDALRRHYEDNYPSLAGAVRTAHDAADVVPVGAAVHDPGELRVGYVGHLYRGRGMELIAELAGLCPWARFHVIGGLPEDIDAWRIRCRDSRNIVFEGFCPPGEVHARMAGLDVMLAPYQRAVATYGNGHDTSRWMSPLKIFEYMASGKPMIVSDLPVLREVLNEANAMLVDPEDVGAWVAALTALRDPGHRERLGNSARRDFLRLHTWDQRARRVLA